MENLNEIIINFINSAGAFGPVFACLLILIESICPVLPLAIFIGINFLSFGNFFGFLISWIFTILGCIFSFIIFRKGFNKKFNLLIKDKNKTYHLMEKFSNISLGSLTVLIAIPFTPAFLINIAAGLSNIDFKKYFVALVIGKISLVYFWGYISTSLLESIKDPIILLRIIFLLILAYLVSKLVNKKFNI
ncbi:MAG: TVP38/TMEM64 family protein [Bacilli bacterium]|nr:TVP38/TMEM64 family protein [Bacilli bacterium]